MLKHCTENSHFFLVMPRFFGRKFHRVALNILLCYPLRRLQYWHFFFDFYDCLFELEGVGVLKREQCPWWFIWHWCFPFLHTDLQKPVLKNQCILFSCFPSVMRQKIQMSNTSCEEKLTAISSSVFRKIMNTNFSRPVKCACSRAPLHPTGHIAPCWIQIYGTEISPPTMQMEISK